MRSVALLFSVALAATSATPAEEPDRRSPIDRYVGNGQYHLMMCQLEVIKATQTASGMGPIRSCIQAGKEILKGNFSSALRTVKKPKAQEALKSYHVALVGALEGVAPGSEERKFQYDQRQQALEAKLNEAWARFEVEQ